MKRTLMCSAGILLLLLAMVFPCHAGDTGLVDLLVSQLGVTKPQAEGGAGSIFKTAKSNLSAEDFASIANVVPGMDSLLAAAPESGASSGTLGSVKSMLGKSSGSLGNVMDLAGAFGKLGMGGDMVGKFVPIVLDYVKGSGGEAVMNLLKNAL